MIETEVKPRCDTFTRMPYRQPKQPIRTASKLLRLIFEHIEGREIPLRRLAEALDNEASHLYAWRSGKVEPRVMTVEAMAELLDMEFVLVKRTCRTTPPTAHVKRD